MNCLAFVGGMTHPMKAALCDVIDGKLTKPQVAGEHACAVFADEAICFLKGPRSGPFFCYVPFDAPHDPHIVPEDFPIRYTPDKIPLPPNFLPQHPWDNVAMKIRDGMLLPHPRPPASRRQCPASCRTHFRQLNSHEKAM